MARKTSFYFSFLVLPRDQRRAIEAVWDFCRAVDDAVDEPEVEEAQDQERASRDALTFWRAELARAYENGHPVTPAGRGLQPFITALQLPRQAFEDVIDGVEMDLDVVRYKSFEDLFQYCRRVASAVGLICIRIFGCRNPAASDYALNLGVALQLTNILRDIPDDLARGASTCRSTISRRTSARSNSSPPALSRSLCDGSWRSSAHAPTNFTGGPWRPVPTKIADASSRPRSCAPFTLRRCGGSNVASTTCFMGVCGCAAPPSCSSRFVSGC